MANQFLDIQGLSKYDSLLKGVAGGSLAIAGNVITLKSVSGASLGTITLPAATYNLATANADGLLSKSDFVKLGGIAEGATKVEESTVNGQLKINGTAVTVYAAPTHTAYAAGLYKITTDATGAVTLAAKVEKADIVGLGIPAQDTIYSAVTTAANGLMISTDKSKLDGVAAGAQVNVLEAVSVNGSKLPINSKGVNIDLSAYALKSDITTVMNYKGSVDSYSNLPTSVAKGDVYNIVNADPTHDIEAGSNVAWNGTSWDKLGGTIEMSAIETSAIEALFS